MRPGLVTTFIFALAACKAEALAPPTPVQAMPRAGAAAGDTDVRVMVTEVAAAKACAALRGMFHGLRAPSDRDVVIGVLWLRECETTSTGVHVTFRVAGSGWLWVDETRNQQGGTLAARQYVRFGVYTTVRGAFDVAYARDSHVATLGFTPDQAPDVSFEMIGDLEVDREAAWSAVIGAIGTAFGGSPETRASSDAKSRGAREMSAQLASGFAVTLDLCTGLTRGRLGRPSKAEMAADDVGETWRAPVQIQPGGVMILGPKHAGNGVTLDVEPLRGAVRLSLMCAAQAELIAADFLAGRPSRSFEVLGTFDVRTAMQLTFKPASCPVVVVATPLDGAPARFAWKRPASEIARSTGGPLIACRATPTPR